MADCDEEQRAAEWRRCPLTGRERSPEEMRGAAKAAEVELRRVACREAAIAAAEQVVANLDALEVSLPDRVLALAVVAATTMRRCPDPAVSGLAFGALATAMVGEVREVEREMDATARRLSRPMPPPVRPMRGFGFAPKASFRRPPPRGRH